MKSVELEIMGGLGNQLYQYTVARYFQEKIGCKKLIVNFSGYKNYKIRNFELANFVLSPSVEIINRIDPKTYIVKETFHVIHKLYNIIFKKFIKMYEFRIGKDCYICTDVEVREVKKDYYANCKNLYLYGYFVSSKIAELMRPHLMKEIVLKDSVSDECKILLESMNNDGKKIIGVSIRCDVDYTDNGWPICSREYYCSGIRRILKDMNDSCDIYIFADKISRVKKEKWFSEFDDDRIKYIEGYSVCECFELLRNCDYFVCSNSSFSWWGAFLNYKNSKAVYMPDEIYSEKHREANCFIFFNGSTILNHITGEPVDNVLSIDN